MGKKLSFSPTSSEISALPFLVAPVVRIMAVIPFRALPRNPLRRQLYPQNPGHWLPKPHPPVQDPFGNSRGGPYPTPFQSHIGSASESLNLWREELLTKRGLSLIGVSSSAQVAVVQLVRLSRGHRLSLIPASKIR